MDSNEIGLFIKNKRKEKGLSQKELADILSVSDKAVSKWECGRGAPDYEYLIKISDFFGVSVDYILRIPDSYNSVEESNPSNKNYIFIFLINYALLLLLAFKILDIFNIYPIKYSLLLLDIPTLFFLLLGLNITSYLIKIELDYFRLIKYIFNKRNRIFDFGNHNEKKTLILRCITCVVIAIIIATVRFVVSIIKGLEIDWVYTSLSLIYAAVFAGFYLTLLIEMEISKLKKQSIVAYVFTVIIVILLGITIIVDKLPRKISLYTSKEFAVDAKVIESGYYIIPKILTAPYIEESRIPNDKLKKASSYTFYGKTFQSDDDLYYAEYSDINSLKDDMNIVIMNSPYNTCDCTFIKSSGHSGDEVVFKNVEINHSKIQETIFFNVSNTDEYDRVFLTGMFDSNIIPEISSREIDGIKYYFINSNSYNLAYIFDGYTWYELYANGDRQTLENYVLSFERGL